MISGQGGGALRLGALGGDIQHAVTVQGIFMPNTCASVCSAWDNQGWPQWVKSVVFAPRNVLFDAGTR